VQTTFFTPKDTLPTTNPAKTIYGAAYDVEFGNIATAINTKYDSGSIAAGGIGFALGSAGSPSIYFGVANTSGFYGDGSAGISISTSAIQRVNVNSAGNVAISTPTSGTALIVNGFAGAAALSIVSGSTATTGTSDLSVNRAGGTANAVLEGPNIQLNDTTNTTSTALQNSGGQTELWQYNSGAWHQPLKISNVGAFTINPPTSSASCFTILGVSNAYALNVTSGSTSGQAYGVAISAGTTSADTALLVRNQAATSTFFTIAGNGQIAVSPPGGAVTAFTVTAQTGGYAALFNGANVTSNSFGLVARAGTNVGDVCFSAQNVASTVLLQIYGDGSVVVGSPTGGAKGPGTINVAGGLYVNGTAH